MTFDAKQEASYIVGETEFLAIDYGTSISYYTSAREKTIAFGQTWHPLSFTRGGTDKDLTVNPTKVILVLPVNPAFVSLATVSGLQRISITLIRGFGRDYVNDYRNPWWVGSVRDITVGINRVQCSLESQETFFKSPFPHYRHQAACNHVLYDPNCGLNPLSFSTTKTVTGVTARGRIVTTSGAPPVNDIYTFGQMWQPAGSGPLTPREIMQQAGNQYVLQVPIIGLRIGDTIKVSLGCDKKASTCVDKFSNKVRHTGMSYVPQTNPVLGGF